jgi:MYXO-CTERM domain-containing protein
MRFFGFLFLAAAIGAPVLGACSSGGRSPSVDPTGSTSSAIQGGTNDTADTFAVGVCLPANGLSGPGDCGGVCSGVLIAPNLVVTARHCVDSITSDTVDCSTATFGGLSFPASSFWITTAATMTQSTTGWHQVKTVSVPTSTMLCGNDIALLELTDVIAAGEATPATPAVQYPIYNHLHYSTAETAIGYGESSPGLQSSAETRRERQNTPITCVFDDPISSEDCVTQSSSWAVNARPNEFVAGAGTCQGDSGSGAFDQTLFQEGTATALGVLSRSSTDVDASTCSSAIYTRLDSFRDLIVTAVTTAAADGAYTVPSWTVAVPDDGVYPDGGVTTDSGTTTTTPDSGTTSTQPAGLGGVCGPDIPCAVGSCENNGTTTVCATSCELDGGGCPTGFGCTAGLCFVGSGESLGDTSTSSSSGGCSTAANGGARPVPWVTSGLTLVAVTLLTRRRRKNAPRQSARLSGKSPAGGSNERRARRP